MPPDWFSNPDSLKESFRIASNLDWANIDLSGHPGLCCLFFYFKFSVNTKYVNRGTEQNKEAQFYKCHTWAQYPAHLTCIHLATEKSNEASSPLVSPDLLESMRQAELCDWALDPAIFTSLCDSLNRFFTQKGMITSGSNSPLAHGAPHTLQVPPYTTNPPPSLASLTHPSPLPYSTIAHHISGAQPPRRPLHVQGQGLQRPQLTQPGNTTGKTLTSLVLFITFIK